MELELFCRHATVITSELTLSVSLTVIDIVALLIMFTSYKLKGTDFVIKVFLCSFGCSLTVLVFFLWILYATTSSSCLRHLLVHVTASVSGGSLLWKFFSISFVTYHWITLKCGYQNNSERKSTQTVMKKHVNGRLQQRRRID